MKITVVTITLNAESTIEKTIQSIIGQTYKNIEYIIVDGLSTDGTLNIVGKYRNQIDKVVSEKDKGLYDAMNKGINMASGDYICFMNSGDSFHSNTVIEDVVNSLEIDKKPADVLYGDTHVVQKWGDYYIKPLPIDYLSKDMVFFHQSAFASTRLMKEYHFDTKYRICADYNFFHLLYKKGCSFNHIPLTIADYDISIDSVSARLKKKMYRERMEINEVPKLKSNLILFIWGIKNKMQIFLNRFDAVRKRRIKGIIRNERVISYNLL